MTTSPLLGNVFKRMGSMSPGSPRSSAKSPLKATVDGVNTAAWDRFRNGVVVFMFVCLLLVSARLVETMRMPSSTRLLKALSSMPHEQRLSIEELREQAAQKGGNVGLTSSLTTSFSNLLQPMMVKLGMSSAKVVMPSEENEVVSVKATGKAGVRKLLQATEAWPGVWG